MPTYYSPAVTSLLAEQGLPALGPGTPHQKVQAQLRALTSDDLFLVPVVDDQAAQAFFSGLWLGHDFLDQSHNLSQDLHTQEGSYWHGIMHRREPDYSNAKYWFRRVGRHPIFDAVGRKVTQLMQETAGVTFPAKLPAGGLMPWEPDWLVDVCQGLAIKPNPAAEDLARKIAACEYAQLLHYCGEKAVGG